MSSESVKVCDLEIEKLAELAKSWDEINGVLGQYVSIIKSVHEESVRAGHIHDAILNLRYYAEDYHKFAQGLGSQAASTANSLVSKAEQVDLNLYNEV